MASLSLAAASLALFSRTRGRSQTDVLPSMLLLGAGAGTPSIRSRSPRWATSSRTSPALASGAVNPFAMGGALGWPSWSSLSTVSQLSPSPPAGCPLEALNGGLARLRRRRSWAGARPLSLVGGVFPRPKPMTHAGAGLDGEAELEACPRGRLEAWRGGAASFVGRPANPRRDDETSSSRIGIRRPARRPSLAADHPGGLSRPAEVAREIGQLMQRGPPAELGAGDADDLDAGLLGRSLVSTLRS